MREMIKMVVVLTVLCTFSGGLLAAIRSGTKDKIEYQQLKFVKGPAIKSILEGASNDPIVDRFKLEDGKIERSFFVGVFDGKASAAAFESFGKGILGTLERILRTPIEIIEGIEQSITDNTPSPQSQSE